MLRMLDQPMSPWHLKGSSHRGVQQLWTRPCQAGKELLDTAIPGPSPRLSLWLHTDWPQLLSSAKPWRAEV